MHIFALSVIFFAGSALSFPLQEWDPEEAGKFEGDIDGIENMSQLRAALQNRNKRWPKGVVHYKISSAYSASEVKLIKDALQKYHENTCIRFVEATSEKAYIYVQKLSGCYSSVGKTGKVQTLSLGPGCLPIGTIIHEFMHALGFYHEQSRPDRDDFVRINWQYIKKGKEHNFNKYSTKVVDTQRIAYDYGSLMHYSAKGFSIDKSKYDTITPLKSGVTIGQRKGFSQQDIKKINKYYECPAKL